MKMWIARDHDGSLYVYRKKPLHNGGKTFIAQSSQWWRIDKNDYPEVTFENMPMDAEVYIDIGDDYEYEWVAPEIVCNIEDNTISLC